jgi:hypothetical protein
VDKTDVGFLANVKRILIILHVGRTNGFLQNSKQIFYKVGNSTGVYHGQMNHVNFKR